MIWFTDICGQADLATTGATAEEIPEEIKAFAIEA